MFFIVGINQGRKDFTCNRIVICDCCGGYGRYQVFMTYMYFSFFFIPIFKWKKEYYVQSTCCGTIYALDPEVGGRIAAGEDVKILPQHLFEFCPKCGRRF